MTSVETNPASAAAQKLRQAFWSRVCYLKTVRAADLIRVHHHAQQNGIPPEEAIVELGLLTESQVMQLLAGGLPALASA